MSKLKGDKNFMGLTNPDCILTANHTLMNAEALYSASADL